MIKQSDIEIKLLIQFYTKNPCSEGNQTNENL